MRTKSLLALAALMLFFTSFVEAVEVSRDQAKTAAGNWVRRNRSPLTARFATEGVRRHRTYETKEGVAAYHVVDLEEGGYVILSGDTRLSPVIAFSGEGEFDDSPDNPLRGRLESVWAGATEALPKEGVARMAAVGEARTDEEREWAELLEEDEGPGKAKSYSSISDVRVNPLVQSKWSQSTWSGTSTKVFNYYTPNNAVCGCVATAYAQVMRFWRAPTASVSPGRYLCSYEGRSLYLTMQGGTYDWSNMPLSASSVSSPTVSQCQAIGKLTSDVGIACYMEYGSDESAAYGFYGSKALKDRFGYASAVSVFTESNAYPNQLTSTMRNAILASLDAQMPVVISIKRPNFGGHETVLDGYGYYSGRLYLHMNCGWAGSQDLWYNLMGETLTNDGYSILQDVTFNIHPSQSGDVVSGRVTNSSGQPVSSAVVTITSPSGATASASTNAKGIYYFKIRASGTYRLTATSGGKTGSTSTTIAALSRDLQFDGEYINDFGTVGNRWGTDIVLSESVAPSAPANDNFANARVLSGSSGSVTSSNEGATLESGEPLSAYSSAASGTVWWSWTAPSTGSVRFETAGTAFDTILGVYTGSALASLTRVAVNDDFGSTRQSRCEFSCTAGTRYFIVVAGYGSSARGNITLGWSHVASVARPLNDNFVNATVLTGESGSVSGTTVNATAESNELLTRYYSKATNTVWWTWTAPADGGVAFDTFGSPFDTVMVAGSGSVLSELTFLASNDDYQSGQRTSLVSFPCTAGRRYVIAVAGYNAAAGAVTLNWTFVRTTTRPSNDAFANARVISGTSGSTTGSTVNATLEPGEQAPPFGSTTTNTVWWTWTAPSSGSVQIDTIGSSFDTVLTVYKGSSLGGLTLVVRDDDSGGSRTSLCRFDCTAGTAYRICIAGYNGKSGDVKLQWYLTTPVQQTYTVRYHKNDGGANDVVSTQTLTRDVSANLRTARTQLGWTRSGYTFAGWSTSSTSTTVLYTDGQSVRNLAAAGGTINLYAIWRVSSVVADALNVSGRTFTFGGASSWFAQSTTTHDNALALQSGRIGDNQTSSISTTVTGPVDLSFWWKVSSETTYDKLSLKLDGSAVLGIDPLSGETGWEHKTVSIPAGSHVVTWTYSKDGSLSLGQDCAWLDQLTFTMPQYTIRFIKNDGAGTVTNAVFTYGTSTPLPTLAKLGWTRRGLDFKGWATTSANAASGQIWKANGAMVATPTKPNTTMDAIAVWALKPGYYQLKFQKNDGSGKWRSAAFKYGESSTLPSCAAGLGWTRPGYVFKGWSLTPTGAIWKADRGLCATGIPAGTTRNVYAIWEKEPPRYTIRFIKNDGAGTMTSLAFKHGVTTPLPKLASLGWTRRGLDFKGWATSTALASAGTVWKKDGASVASPTAAGATMDAIAIWSLKSGYYQLKFQKNDGSGKWRSAAFKYGDKSTLPSCAAGLGWTRPGYVFKGWSLTPNGAVWKTDRGICSTGIPAGTTRNVYAIWAKSTASIGAMTSVEAMPKPVMSDCLAGDLATGDGTYLLWLDPDPSTGVLLVMPLEGAPVCEPVTLTERGQTLEAETVGGEVYWLAR